jgi:small subunit ribosomal protein S4
MSVCGSVHCALRKRPAPPGERKRRRRSKDSDFKTHLIEKQRLRHSYWVSEKQFRRYVREAMRQKGVTGENLMRLLELRLDTMVHRMGFAPTLPSARQLVVHGHVEVNGKKVDRPSSQVKRGDDVALRERSRNIPLVREGLKRGARPPYVSVDEDALRGTLQAEPFRRDIPVMVNDSLVVEYYTKYL